MTVRCSVIIATRNRRASVLRTIERLRTLPERPAVILVDNGSDDDTVRAVRGAHPGVDVIPLRRNLGAPARNIGVVRAHTPYVAFADDDSWWAPGSLTRAVARFDADPRLGLLAARILVGQDEREDPTTATMDRSPLPDGGVLGFVACGAVVRRSAWLDVGGFDDLLFFFGEEERVALDLAARGWRLVYDRDVVAHHHPSPPSDVVGRQIRQRRNEVLTSWLRRPRGVALRATAQLARDACRGDRAAQRALVEVAARLPTALRRRSPVAPEVERARRLLAAAGRDEGARPMNVAGSRRRTRDEPD